MEINVINFNKNQLKWIVSVAGRAEFLKWNMVGARLGENVMCVLRTRNEFNAFADRTSRGGGQKQQSRKKSFQLSDMLKTGMKRETRDESAIT